MSLTQPASADVRPLTALIREFGDDGTPQEVALRIVPHLTRWELSYHAMFSIRDQIYALRSKATLASRQQQERHLQDRQEAEAHRRGFTSYRDMVRTDSEAAETVLLEMAEFTQELLDSEFQVHGEGPVLWGDATADQHRRTASRLEASVNTMKKGIALHRLAVKLINAGGVKCLRDLNS